MKAVLNGKDRGKIHEILRKCTMENGQDFLKRLEKESEIGLKKGEIESLTNIKQLIGRAPEQVEEFIKEEINPLLNQYPSYLYSLTPIEI